MLTDLSTTGTVLLVLLSAAAVFAVICLISMVRDGRRFVVRRYRVSSGKLAAPKRLVYISDMHEKQYGDDNEAVVQAVRDAKPDLILIGGDTIVALAALKCAAEDPAWCARSRSLLRRLTEIAPVYFADGNHELRLRIRKRSEGRRHYDRLADMLRETGVICLHNRCEEVGELRLCGLELTDQYYLRFKKHRMEPDAVSKFLHMESAGEDRFSVLLAHDPEYFASYAAWGADLTLSGHLHGGIMRLPFIGGVVSPNPALFPKYNGGLYRIGKRSMIVSCGLGEHTLPIRIFNPGEISVIDLVPASRQ